MLIQNKILPLLFSFTSTGMIYLVVNKITWINESMLVMSKKTLSLSTLKLNYINWIEL